MIVHHESTSFDFGVEVCVPLKGDGLSRFLGLVEGEESGGSSNSPSMLPRGDTFSTLQKGRR